MQPLSQTGLVILLYLRVSTEEQHKKGFSVPEQRRALAARAKALAKEARAELRLYEFEDHVGGDFLDRPALDQVRQFLRATRVDVFLCLDPDRFSRKLVNQLLIAEEIERTGARLEFLQHEYRRDADGQAFFQIRGVFAELEKAKILERTQRGKRGKIAEGGIPQAFHLYGYTYIKRAPRGTCPLAVNADQAEWVRQMFRWSADEGCTTQEIARRLTAMGVATPRGRRREWNRSTVADILRNRAYTGQAQLNKEDFRGISALRQFPASWRQARGFKLTARTRPAEEWRPVPVPALVDEVTFARAQQTLEKHKKVRRVSPDRLLKGKGRCALCSGAVYYGSRGRGARTYMTCRNRYGPRQPGAPECRLPQKRTTAVEEAVWAKVCSWILNPELIRVEADDRGIPVASDQAASVEVELQLLRQQLAGKEAEQERIGLLFARGLWPEERTTRALAAVNGEISELRIRAQQLDDQLRFLRPRRHDVTRVIETASQLRDQVGDLLHRLPPAERARIVDDLVDYYVLHPTGHMEPVVVEVLPRTD